MRNLVVGAALCAVLLMAPRGVTAGPPFRTDDPEPVPYQRWEIYVGGSYAHDGDSSSIDAPFVEANYGPLPNVQLSLTLPVTYERNESLHSAYRYGETQVGVKFRFVPETHNTPQVAFYPILELSSSGDKSRTLLPIWVQKTSGSWTVYGGGGFIQDPNPGRRESFFAGATILRRFSDQVAVGAEVFRQTASRTNDDAGQSGFNVGIIREIGDSHAILLSAGRSFGGRYLLSLYCAYEIRLARASQAQSASGSDGAKRAPPSGLSLTMMSPP